MMLNLAFAVEGVSVKAGAAAPTLVFRLRVTEADGQPVHAIALRARIQIEARRRRYAADEQVDLLELFGEPARWDHTLGAVAFADVAVMVPGFEGSVTVDVPVPCTYDFEVAATKYLRSVDGADVPLTFLFSGTAFTRGPAGFGVEPLSSELEASWNMPADTWRDLMELYFPGAGWLRLRHDRFDALARYKAVRALATWDLVIDSLLAEAGALVEAGDPVEELTA